MKKTHIASIFFLLTAALLLSGCGYQETAPSSGTSSEISESNSSSDSITSDNNSSSILSQSNSKFTTDSRSEAPEESEEPLEQGEQLVLVGLDGKIISEKDIIKICGDDWKEAPLSEITAGNFSYAEVTGAYISMPTRSCRTTADNADVFDSKNKVFTDLPVEHKTDFFRIFEGDEMCGFKVRSASSQFSKDLLEETGVLPRTNRKYTTGRADWNWKALWSLPGIFML